MPLHWSDHSSVQEDSNDLAIDRLNDLLLGRHHLLSQYGLGPHRSLEQYEEYANLNFNERINRVGIPTLFDRELDLETSDIELRQDYQYWIFSLQNTEDEEIFRYDIIDPGILGKYRNKMKIRVSLSDCPQS